MKTVLGLTGDPCSLAEVARPYIETQRTGDYLEIGPCNNPRGWTTVFRNEKPIHHFADKSDAIELMRLIRAG